MHVDHRSQSFQPLQSADRGDTSDLHADNAQDAEALFASMGKDGPEIAHEQIAGYVHLGDVPSGGTIYELVVRRERPTWMPPHVAGAGHAYFLALDTREGIE